MRSGEGLEPAAWGRMASQEVDHTHRAAGLGEEQRQPERSMGISTNSAGKEHADTNIQKKLGVNLDASTKLTTCL